MSKTNNNSKVYLNAKGERVLRITEVIKTLAKDQLILWANMLGFKRVSYTRELERTANIGSMVHGHIEDYNDPHMLATFNYEEYGVYDDWSKNEADNAIHSFMKWMRENHKIFKVVATEQTIVGEKLGGTIDTLIKGIKNPNKVIIVDYKTSGDFYLTMFLQLAGYVQVYEELHGKGTVEAAAIFLLDKKHGDKAAVRMIPRSVLEVYISCFNFMVGVAYGTKVLADSFKDDLVKMGR